MKLVILIAIALTSIKSQSQSLSTLAVFSPEIGDSFDIHISSGKIDKSKPIKYIYYLDANIRSGKELRKQISEAGDSILFNRVFAGIGHRGNFHQKRRRDFVPPSKTGFKHGHADQFYHFLTTIIIPTIEARFGQAYHRGIIGHSFGGLFSFYCLFRNQRVFQSYYSLSPSLWMNKYSILKQEATYFSKSTKLPVFLYLSAGTLEGVNYILTGNRRMRQLLDIRKYEGFRFYYQEHSFKTHHSQVPESFRYILRNLER